jgi:hypothetical protein
MIGEVAARLSGGYMSGWTYPYASGVQPIRGAIQAALGQRPDGLAPSRVWTCAERAFISIPGRVRSILGIEAARETPGVRDLFLRAESGKDVAFPENNVSKCGNIIASAPSRKEAVRAAEQAARGILIRLEPGVPATDAFLAALPDPPDPGRGPAFPPNAFALGPELRAALSRLPDTPPPPPEDLSSAVIVPFPEFVSLPLRDYAGRTIGESLDAVRKLSGLPLPLSYATPRLGRRFWAALIRGGYQGAAYFIDNLGGIP